VRSWIRRNAWLVVAILLVAARADALPVTLSQVQLLTASDITPLFGGNGSVIGRVADGDGVLFEIEGGTIDYGKVAVRLVLYPADLGAFESFGLRIEIVSAPAPVEINPFLQTGPTGGNFAQAVPGAKQQGDAFDSFVPLAGVPQLASGFALGFQYFTAGDVLEPPAQTVRIRVSPIPGAATVEPIPEPAPLLLAALGVSALALARRGR
jgi:hypothetical protein